MKSAVKINIKRASSLLITFLCLFSACIIRIIVIQKNSIISDVAEIQFTKSVILGETRGYIYDRNYEPLVNTDKIDKTLILSNDIESKFLKNNDKYLFEEIKPGILMCLSDYFDSDNSLQKFTYINRYSDETLCRHIIGYTDSSGKGICGIEKAFDNILEEASGELKITYNSDASGVALVGDGIKIYNNNYNSSAGIVLTIDKNIQEITEKAVMSSEIVCGSAVVMDVNSFEILSLVSVPSYNPLNVAESLNDENKPFLNRALCAYPAGSVFKPFVAICALENRYKISDKYECKGYVFANGNTFRCYNSNEHGTVDLNKAIEKSCNTFFINLGLETGAENLINTLKKFGFGKEIKLCSTIISDNGNLPVAEGITSSAELATICFGQGELLITPVQLAAAYSVLANGGTYKEPVLLKELIDNASNVYAQYRNEVLYTATEKKYCELINSALYNNMLNGTGINGASDFVSSAGKTATAQTGIFNTDGTEQLCTWFAGFFPYENPKYAVVVFNEKGSTASIDCAPVFKNIIEEITKYQNGLS